jgi:hypothetical protein
MHYVIAITLDIMLSISISLIAKNYKIQDLARLLQIN